ncbi:hypothetical protein [Vibrio viridaestus]
MKEKAWKNGCEAKFEQMVANYHKEKEVLASMEEGSDEYNKQKKHCDSLFASAEKFFSQYQ